MINLRRCLFAIVAVWMTSAVSVRAENWPEFRGPTGQGISQASGLPLEWSDTKNVAWKQAVPGLGWSSPVVVEGRVYLTTAIAADDGSNDQSLSALCLDAGRGDILWNATVFVQRGALAPGIHGKNSHASPTPLVHGDRLFVHFGHQGTACLDLQGNVQWRNTELKYPPVHGNGGTPVLVDGRLIFSCDGGSDPFVAALDADSGQVLWKTPREVEAAKTFAFSTPLVITVGGRRQVISPGANLVSALDPRDGKEIWRVRYEGYSVIPRPVFGHGLVFIGTGFDSASVMAIRPGGRGDVTETHVAWTVREAAPHSPSLLLLDSELYMVSDRGIVTCLEAKTGQTVWQKRVGGNFSASPLYADGKIYLQSEDGVGTVIRAGAPFEKLATNPLNERTLASYAVSNSALFIRSDKHLYRIQAGESKQP